MAEPAAARHDQHVGPRNGALLRQFVEARDGGGHFAGRLLALHGDRPDQHAAWETVGHAMQDVADHRARRRGHDADHLRQEGQLALLVEVEQSLGREFLAAVFQQLEQRALARQL
jgi:hypothetical protein